MRLQHNPHRALTVFDDALLALVTGGCPNCQAPIHLETIVVVRRPKVTSLSCVACAADAAATAALPPPPRSP